MKFKNKTEYEEYIKRERRDHFITPFDLAYETFIQLKFDKQPVDFFRQNASSFIEQMREACWKDFQEHEKEFTRRMLVSLIDKDKYGTMDPIEAIEGFVTEYPDYLYALCLSNTQSRRSRAGKEFEAILELLLVGCDILVDSQGVVGKKTFEEFGLGKLVDFVSPGAVHFTMNKRYTTLISAKTTLRERWQEVPEEVDRTGISQMYLATLDENITGETLDILYEKNITIATTCSNKDSKYQEHANVESFEKMVSEALENARKWDEFSFKDVQAQKIIDNFNNQLKRHANHEYLRNYYQNKLDNFSKQVGKSNK